MSTYIIASCTVKDREKFSEYSAQAAPTFLPYGGKLTQKGKLQATLTGKSGASISGRNFRAPSNMALLAILAVMPPKPAKRESRLAGTGFPFLSLRVVAIIKYLSFFTATVRTIFHSVPIAFPFLSPRKRPSAGRTYLFRQGGLFMTTHAVKRSKNLAALSLIRARSSASNLS